MRTAVFVAASSGRVRSEILVLEYGDTVRLWSLSLKHDKLFRVISAMKFLKEVYLMRPCGEKYMKINLWLMRNKYIIHNATENYRHMPAHATY